MHLRIFLHLAFGWGLYNLPLSQTLFILSQPLSNVSTHLDLPLPEFHLPDHLAQRWRQEIKYQAVELARKTDVYYEKYLRLRQLNSRRYRRMLNNGNLHLGIYKRLQSGNYTQILKDDYGILSKYIVFLKTVNKGIPKYGEFRLWLLTKRYIIQTKKMLTKIESALYMEEEKIPHVVYKVDKRWRSFTRVFHKYMRDVTLLKELHFFFEDMSNHY